MANISNLSLRSILDKDNLLVGSNFLEWLRKLKIVLRHEGKLHVLEEEEVMEPGENAAIAEYEQYQKFLEDSIDVQCLMLSAMSSELQKQHEKMSAKEIYAHLQELFQESARTERYNTSRALFNCKMAEGSQVGPHVLKMIGYIERLENLGSKLNDDLAIDLILSSLPDSFSQFVMNFNMNNMERSLTDLLAMLRIAEKDMKSKTKAPQQVLLIGKTNKRKASGNNSSMATQAKKGDQPKKNKG